MIYILYALSITVMVTLDQFSKYLILQNFSLYDVKNIIDNFFSITYIKNYGAGFSTMQNETVFLIVVPIIVIGLLSYLLIRDKNETNLSKCAYLLIIGGALGNLLDRIRFSYVVDFLDFIIFGYDFPVFNLADCFITIGGFLIIIAVLMESKNAKN